jgi:hypothetical protein
MSCPFDREKLTGYYDGELVAAEKAEVERHISACSECLRDLGELKAASLLVKELPRPRAPRSIAEGVSREIAESGRVRSLGEWRRRLLWAASAAAGLFIVLNVVFFARHAPETAGPVAAKAPTPAIGFAPLPSEKEAGPRSLGKFDDLEQTERFRGQADRNALKQEAEDLKKTQELLRDKGADPQKKAAGLALIEEKQNRARAEEPAAKGEKPAEAPRAPAAALPPAPPPPAAKPMAKADAPAPGKAEPAPAPKPDARPATPAPVPGNEQLHGELRQRELAAAAAPAGWTCLATDPAAARAKVNALVGKWAQRPADGKLQEAEKARDDAGPLAIEITNSQLEVLKKELAKDGIELLAVDPAAARRGAGRAEQKDLAGGGGAGPGATGKVPAPEERKAATEGLKKEPADPKARAAFDELAKEQDAAKTKSGAVFGQQQGAGAEPRVRILLHFVAQPSPAKNPHHPPDLQRR